MASDDTGEMETSVTTQNASYEPKVTIDASAYPHIIDETLDYILMDHASALPLILVCRAWKRTICSAVYAHIRAEPSWGPSELGEQDVKTLAGWFQISTVPPPGRQRLSFPELQWSGAVSLPKALVSAAPYIQAFDVHGPMAADYLQTLWQLNVKVTMIRIDDYLLAGHVLRGMHDMPSLPSDPRWLPIPEPNLVRRYNGARDRSPRPVTVHIAVWRVGVPYGYGEVLQGSQARHGS